MNRLPGETSEQRDARKTVEKPLGELHALLGETPEASAAVSVMRDLTAGAHPADAAFCILRMTLAVEQAVQAAYRRGYDKANADREAADLAERDAWADSEMERHPVGSEDDGDALASAGTGTSEDYGDF